MGIVRILDDHIANQIAAGEVVERPSSVVKELVENAIDAGSTRIDVTVEEGGLQLIRIADNGSGIMPEDLETAFQRHATSKIITSKDLFQIRTLGFRGEALPSIAAVAKVECITATDDSGLGRRIAVEGGAVKALEDAAASKGTDIRVKELFYNTPARLKYMKTIQTELSHVSDYIYRLALSHPEIAFTLKHNGSVLLQSLGNGDLLQVIAGIYGTGLAKMMLPIQAENPDYRITGYVSKPEQTRSNRQGITTVINGRYIRNFGLAQALLKAYHTLLPINRYPIAVLQIEMDPTLLDVNVHPSKLEVRFSKESELLELLERTVKNMLNRQVHIPQGGRSSGGKPAVVQEQLELYRQEPSPRQGGWDLFGNRQEGDAAADRSAYRPEPSGSERGVMTSAPYANPPQADPKGETAFGIRPTEARDTDERTRSVGPPAEVRLSSGTASPAAASSDAVQPDEAPSNTDPYSVVPHDAAQGKVDPHDGTPNVAAQNDSLLNVSRINDASSAAAPSDTAPSDAAPYGGAPYVSAPSHASLQGAASKRQSTPADSGYNQAARGKQQSYSAPSQPLPPGASRKVLDALDAGPSDIAPRLPKFPSLDPIGQLHGTYIVAQNEGGLYLIDQHAAHERINYEYYFDLFGKPQEASQELLVPFTLEFTPSEAELLKTRLNYLEQVGVYLEAFGGNTFLVRAYPHWFPKGEEKEIIDQMTEWVLAEKKAIDLSKLREASSTLCSCKSSIKANQALTKVEMEVLLDRLAACRIPYTCPHGRPIVVSFSTYELEKMFKRVM